MSVSLWVGSTTSPANVVNKDIDFVPGTSPEFDCELKQPCDVTHPVFILKAADESQISKLDNYAYSRTFGRYYFAEVSLTPQGYVVSCTCDPLMSFKSDILELEAVIARNEEATQNMIADSSYVTGAQDTTWYKNFPEGEHWMKRASDMGRRYILMVT